MGALAALLIAVVVAPWLLALVGRPASSVYEATGYRTLVNELVAGRGWLRLDLRSDPMRVVPSELAPVDDPAFRAFMNGSYLAADMKKADASVWRVEEGGARVLAIRRDAHRILGPFATGKGWSGSLLYRGDRQATPILVSRATGAELSLASQGESHAAVAVSTVELDGRPVRGTRSAQRYVFTEGAQTAAVVMRVGDQALVQVFATPGVAVELEGRVLAAREGSPRLVPMRPHDTLSFRHDGRETRFDLDMADPAISRELPGRGRVRDPGLDSFARAAEAAMADGEARKVQLTIDSGLQATAQAALEARAEQLRAGGQAFPAGVTLMDAMTGEVLALGTYPRDRSQLGSRQAASLQPDPLIERNHNFDRLPVGSVAKAPLSLAILQANPTLATLVIPSAQERQLSTDRRKTKRSFRELLGVDIGMDIEDHVVVPGGIDFHSFLAQSSNKYAAALMLLGFGEGGPAVAGESEPWTLAGRRRTTPPSLNMLQAAQPGPYGLVPRLQHDAAPPWPRQLPILFGVRAEADPSGKAPAFDAGIWGRRGLEHAERYAAASPELEDFGLSDVSEIGPDYIMTILGGARGRWTTVKMAEVFSRIVTRRPIRSQLVAGARPAPRVLSLPIRDEAWNPVIDGLKAVVTEGTGRSLRDAIPQPVEPGLEVRLFAKTGTPNLDRFGARTRANAALARYVERRCPLAWRSGAGLYVPAAGPRAWRRDLLAGVNRMGARCHDGQPELVMQEIVRLNALGQPRGGLIDGLRLEGGRVVGIPLDAVSFASIGHAVAVVAGLYRAGDPDDQPQRALTMVINIQQRTDADRTPALQVARSLLCDPAVRAWLVGGASRPGPGCGR
jgi:hypothetical protein